MSDNKNEKQADYERGQEAGSQAGFYEKTLHSYERAFQSDAYRMRTMRDSKMALLINRNQPSMTPLSQHEKNQKQHRNRKKNRLNQAVEDIVIGSIQARRNQWAV